MAATAACPLKVELLPFLSQAAVVSYTRRRRQRRRLL